MTPTDVVNQHSIKTEIRMAATLYYSPKKFPCRGNYTCFRVDTRISSPPSGETQAAPYIVALYQCTLVRIDVLYRSRKDILLPAYKASGGASALPPLYQDEQLEVYHPGKKLCEQAATQARINARSHLQRQGPPSQLPKIRPI